MQIEAKLQALGLVLPPAPKIPPGINIAFAWVRLRNNRLYLAGHTPQAPDGSPLSLVGFLIKPPPEPHGP